jgi:hypothetical protein
MGINKYLVPEMRNSETFTVVFLMLSAMSNSAALAESNASYVDFGCTVLYADGEKIAYTGRVDRPNSKETLVTFIPDSKKYRSLTKSPSYSDENGNLTVDTTSGKIGRATLFSRHKFYLNERSFASNGYVVISSTTEIRIAVPSPRRIIGTGICEIKSSKTFNDF